MVASRQVEIPFYRGMGNVGGDSVHLHKFLVVPLFPFCVNMKSLLRNVWMPSGGNSLCQILQMLLVVGKDSRQQQRVCEHKVWENNGVVVSGKQVDAESFQQNLQKKPVGLKETRGDIFINISH